MPQPELYLIALVLLAVPFAMLFLLRRSKGGGASLREANARLSATLERRESELREALKDANGFEALARERRTEIDRLNGDLSRLRARLDHEAREQRELTGRTSYLEARLEAERQVSEERIQLLTDYRKEMQAKFSEMASEALRLQGERFSKSSLEKLETALTPLREHVGHFEQELKNVHQETIRERELLKFEIAQLGRRSEEISQEAVALTRALKSDPRIQGAWGEMVLERILQGCGLREGEEYETQTHRVSDDGDRLRPDVIIHIPGGKTLVIDSKVSLVAYADIVNSETEEEAAGARKRHVASLHGHITRLASKDYQYAEEVTVDYVIMFVPIEGALSEALREDNSITEFALERNVTIATPTTLMMALRTIANVWAFERRSQNAEEIAYRAGRLYDKVAGFVDSMNKVGKRLDQAQSAYQAAFVQLSRGRGNMLSQVEMLKTLGAKTTASIGADFDDTDGTTTMIDTEVPSGGTA